ncbi:MAG: ABC transporter permease [Deltaproteobacteria bacterium]|nr:ABC transporter permease [Deltaproteobacteria bacterium]
MNGAQTVSRLGGVFAVLRRNLRVWRRFFWASTAADLAGPMLCLAAIGYGLGELLGEVDGMSYMRFLAPGMVVLACMFAASVEGTHGAYTRLKPQGLFDGILATPIDPAELVLAEILFAAIKALVAGCAVLGVVAVLGLTDSLAVLAVPLLCALCGVLFGGLALLVSALSPSHALFGYYFTWMQTMAWLNPLTHAASAAQALFAGRLDLNLLMNVTWLVVAATLPFWPAVYLFKRRLIK